jgi:hypothetical protein
MKFVTWDMIFSLTVIPKVISTRLLIRRVAVVHKYKKPLRSVYIPYVKGDSEKFKCIGDRYNIEKSSKLNPLKSSLIKTRPQRHPQQMPVRL